MSHSSWGGSEVQGTQYTCVYRGRSSTTELQIPLTFSQNWAVTWGNKKTQQIRVTNTFGETKCCVNHSPVQV